MHDILYDSAGTWRTPLKVPTTSDDHSPETIASSSGWRKWLSQRWSGTISIDVLSRPDIVPQVVVVGAGPTGLMLAFNLVRHSLFVEVLKAKDESDE